MTANQQSPDRPYTCCSRRSSMSTPDAADRRAITPLFWTHVRPYGAFRLHLDRYLDLDPRPQAA